MDIRQFFGLKNAVRAREADPGPAQPPGSAQPPGPAQPLLSDEPDATGPDPSASGHSEMPIPEKPFQPEAHIISVQNVNKRRLSFQQKWFKDYPWLHYDVKSESVMCIHCIQASDKKLNHLSKKADGAFISTGFKNWKKAIERFQSHEKSNHHKLSVTNLMYHKRNQPVNAQLSQHVTAEQALSRQALLKLITSLKFLAKQGVALRGHDEDYGNFQALLKLRAEDDGDFEKWLKRRISYTSPKIQNEILGIMGKTILRDICKEVYCDSHEFGIIMDGTQDIQGIEQQCICIRYFTKELIVEEKFLGLYEMQSTTGNSLSKMLFDVLIRLSLPLSSLRSQTYDGASNMSGQYKGCQAEVKRSQPLALYVHCGAHATHLVTSKAVQASQTARNALDNVQQLGNLYKDSGKFKSVYLNDTSDYEANSPGALKPICPTRFLTRSPAVKSVLKNYENILCALQKAAKEFGTKTASRANGLNTAFSSPLTVLGLLISVPVLDVLERLNATLQGSSVTVSGMLEAVDSARKQLQSVRTNAAFHDIFCHSEEKCSELQLESVSLPRRRKVPKKYDSAPTTDHVPASEEEYYRAEFFRVIDSAMLNLDEYFTSTDLLKYKKLCDSLLTDTVDTDTVKRYPELADFESLKLQLGFFRSQYQPKTIAECQKLFREMTPEVRQMFPLVEKLLRIVMISPASSCSAERSFSALRRLKTYLRSMTQTRLNHILLCHIHQDHLTSLDAITIAREFVAQSNEARQQVFGNF